MGWVEWLIRLSWSLWKLLTWTTCHTNSVVYIPALQFLQVPHIRGVHPHMGVHLEWGEDPVLPGKEEHQESWVLSLLTTRDQPGDKARDRSHKGVESNTQPSWSRCFSGHWSSLQLFSRSVQCLVHYIVQSVKCKVHWSSLYRFRGCWEKYVPGDESARVKTVMVSNWGLEEVISPFSGPSAAIRVGQ